MKLLLILFLITSKTMASPMCFVQSNKLIIKDLRAQPPATCSDLNEVNSFIKNISQLATFLRPSIPVIIDVKDRDSNAYYQAAGYLYLPMQISSTVNWYEYQTKLLTKAVWAHEYGHVIFNSNFIYDSKKYKNNFELYQKRDYIIERMEQGDTDLNLELALEKINRTITENPGPMDKIAAYDELFADIVAVLYYNDPQIMSKALTFKEMSPEASSEVRERDFTIYKDPDTFNSTDPLAHDLLTPSRFSFWKNYKKCRKIFTKQEALSLAYKAIMHEAIDVLDNGIKSTQAANKNLIKRFNSLIRCD